jgi:hypothetical protein
MPLDIPDLDDRRWADLVEDARALIPRVAPQWTDHNAHDPGITFIELFAWLAEMQLYQLNRVGERHRVAFARLAGVRRRQRIPARVLIRVDGKINVGVFLRAGTQLTPVGADDLIFETETDLFLTASRLQRVVVDDGTATDETNANERSGVAFLAFGEAAAAGASLRLGFDAFYPSEPELRLTFDVFTDDLVARCDAQEAPGAIDIDREALAAPPVEVAWEYLGVDGWRPLEVIADATGGFATSGSVTLPTPQEAIRQQDVVWIRGRIVRGAYDIEPRLRNVAVNVVPCLQKETVRDEVVGTGNGRPDQNYSLTESPVLVPADAAPAALVTSDVADWPRLMTEARRTHPELGARLFDLRNASSDGSDPDYRRVRELNRDLAGALTAFGPLLGREPVVVTVDDELWQRVESFDGSHAGSKHFVLDAEAGRLLFGNGLNGRIPAEGEEIRAVWYRASAGSKGNVAADQRWRSRTADVTGVTLRNVAAATGGAEPETIAELELRGQAKLRRPGRAVTLGDLERLALATPHVHVARAKAIANCPQPEMLTVVAVPKVRPGRKRPPTQVSQAFLTAVRRHLEGRRLICDNLSVIAPVFIEVRVSARLRLVKGASPAAVLERAREALDRFLRGELDLAGVTAAPAQAIASSPCPTRWPFGRAVVPSEIYAVLDTVKGVESAWNVVLRAHRGSEVVLPDDSGAIPLPPVGLVAAGAHDVAIDDRPRSRP